MRRTTMVTGIYILLIGLVLAIIGFASGAPKNVIWDHGFQVSKRMNKTDDVQKFSSIKISDGDGRIQVVSGDKTSGNKFQIQTVGDDQRTPKYKIKDGTLYIERKTKSGFSFSGNQELTVTIPQNVKLDNITAKTNYEGLNISGITVKNIDITPASDTDGGDVGIDSTRVLESAKLDIHNSRLSIANSELNHMIVNSFDMQDDGDSDEEDSEDYTDINDDDNLSIEDASIYISGSTIKNSRLSMSAGGLIVKDHSTFDNVKTNIKTGSVKVGSTKLKGMNEFNITRGSFRGNVLQMDGVDLSNQRGRIRYFGDSTDNHVFQANPGAENLLKVNGDNLAIRIK